MICNRKYTTRVLEKCWNYHFIGIYYCRVSVFDPECCICLALECLWFSYFSQSSVKYCQTCDGLMKSFPLFSFDYPCRVNNCGKYSTVKWKWKNIVHCENSSLLAIIKKLMNISFFYLHFLHNFWTELAFYSINKSSTDSDDKHHIMLCAVWNTGISASSKLFSINAGRLEGKNIKSK